MGIFKNITKTLKKAAPLIGSAIGMYFGGPVGASIGSGIGSLAAGRRCRRSFINAALAGVIVMQMGGKDFGKGLLSTLEHRNRSSSNKIVVTGNPSSAIKLSWC